MKYLRRRREEKLYKQWSEHSNLPYDAIPQRETSQDKSVSGEKRGMNVRVLYIMFGVALIVLVIGVILLAVQSC
jgi:hypothetical protein